MKPYEISILNADLDNVLFGPCAVVSVLYAPEFTSDVAPSVDETGIVQELSSQLGGEWEISSAGWDSGDHPTRLEAIARFIKIK